MDRKKIRYLAFEGGGGKAIVYLGALRVLEEIGLLPYERPVAQTGLNGVAGSSGGAITAFFIALGLTSDEIAENADSGNFDTFFDQPERGFYKAVVYNPENDGRNTSGYSVGYPKPFPKNSVPHDVNDASRQFFSTDVDRARTQGMQLVHLRQRRFLGLSALFDVLAALLLPFVELVTKDERQSPIVNKILNVNPIKTIKYLHSLLYDRGFFAGIATRDYFAGELKKWSAKRYGKSLTTTEARNYTFEEFYQLTGALDFPRDLY